MGSTAMADETQSLWEIIIKIAQTPCLTLKSATASLGWLLQNFLFFFPGGGWAGILFNIPVIRVVIFVVFDFNTNFTFYNQINWSRCRRITPVEKGYKDTQGLSQQTSSGRSSIGDAFAGKEGMGWYGIVWYG